MIKVYQVNFSGERHFKEGDLTKIEIDFESLIKTEKRVRELKEMYKESEITVRISKKQLSYFISFGIVKDFGEALNCKIIIFEGDDIGKK